MTPQDTLPLLPTIYVLLQNFPGGGRAANRSNSPQFYPHFLSLPKYFY